MSDMTKPREWWICTDALEYIILEEPPDLEIYKPEHGLTFINVIEHSAHEQLLAENKKLNETCGYLRQTYKGACEAFSEESAENRRLRAALEWIKKSGEILYRNELENEPYLKLVLEYRKHKDVSAKALANTEQVFREIK